MIYVYAIVEDNKEVIKSHESKKDKQHNDQNKKDKRKKNDPQTPPQKTEKKRSSNTQSHICVLIQLNYGLENQLMTGFHSNDRFLFIDCVNNPCVYGTCSSSTSGYRCSCNAGFVGPNCNIGK